MGHRRVARIDETNPPGAGGLRHATPLETLDLHGMNAARARRAISRFLATSARRHPGGVVRIITGRGVHSDGAPVLGATLDAELRRLTTIVAEHQPAPDGGSLLIRLQ